MIQKNVIGSFTEIYVGGGNFITENYPTLYPTFSVRKVLTNGDSEGNYREVTASEKATIESNVAKLIEAGNGVRTEMTPYFEASGAVFEDKTGYYYFNGIKDLTEEDMRKIFVAGVPTIGSHQASSDYRVRTFLPVNNITGQIPFPGDIDCFCYGNRNLEVFNHFRNYIIVAGCLRRSFTDNPKLRKIGNENEYINASKYVLYNPSGPKETFSELPMLEHVYIYKLRSDIQFRDSPLLDYDSVLYMVNNAANTSPITIYVHADVMAKLNDETNTEWHQILTDAAAKQITFATLT